MNYEKDKRFILVYKKDKNNNYLFDSVDIVYKSENGEFISNSGKLKGKNIITEVPHFISSTSLLLFEPCKAVLYSANLESCFDEYVYYDITDKIYNAIKDQTQNKQVGEILLILGDLGKSTQFFKKEGTMFSVQHSIPLKYQKQIKIIQKKLQSEKESGYIDVNSTNKNNYNKNFQTWSIVGNHDMHSIDPRTSKVRQLNEYGEYTQKTIEEQNPIMNINQIISDIKGKIVGQDEAVEAVVANIYANQILINSGNKDLISTQKASILIDGPTGTGKTAIVKEIADKLEIPIVTVPATSFSATGYVGDSITEILIKLYKESNGNLELAQRAVVCIDEIDKLGGFAKEKELSMRKAVQQELLGFISGGKYNIEIGGHMGPKVEFDTTNLTIIGLGAFTSIRDEKIEKQRRLTEKNLIGFARDGEESKNVSSGEKTYVMNEQDYIEYGLERELVGRFSLLASTKAYTKEGYKRILLESKISPLKAFIDFSKSFGVEEVIYDDDFINKICEMAYEANFGARGLHQIISTLKNVLLLDIINNKNKTITLTVDMLDKVKEKNIRTY